MKYGYYYIIIHGYLQDIYAYFITAYIVYSFSRWIYQTIMYLHLYVLLE